MILHTDTIMPPIRRSGRPKGKLTKSCLICQSKSIASTALFCKSCQSFEIKIMSGRVDISSQNSTINKCVKSSSTRNSWSENCQNLELRKCDYCRYKKILSLNKSDFDDIKNSVEKKEFLIDEDEIFNGPYMKRSSSAPIVNPNVELEDSTIMALNLVEHNDLMNRKRNLSNQSKSKETNSHIESSFTIETILRVDKEPTVRVVNKLKSDQKDHPNSAIPESKKFDMKSYKLKQSLSQKLSSSGTISTNSFNSTTTTNNERNPETSNSKRTRDWVNNVAADGGQDNSDEALSTDRDTGIYWVVVDR